MRQLILLTAFLLCACDSNIEATTEPSDSKLPKESAPTQAYGSWPSPITAEHTVVGSRGIGSLQFDGGYLYWSESRPSEGGRNTIMRWQPGGEVEEILPAPWNARSRVHEYGGRAFLASGGNIWFSNFPNQQLYRLAPGEEPETFTTTPGLRFAACEFDQPRERLICVQEDHRSDGEPTNGLVALPLDGNSEPIELFSSSDFVSAPSLSPDGKRIAFVSWDHPNMPWDNTTLRSARFGPTGQLEQVHTHNPDTTESILDPQWDTSNRLYALSDRDDWWKIYQVDGQTFKPLKPMLDQNEIGGAAWGLGGHYFRFSDSGDIIARVMQGGIERLLLLNTTTGDYATLPFDGVAFSSPLVDGDHIYVVTGPTNRRAELVRLKIDGRAEPEIIRTAGDTDVEPAWIPAYQRISFPTADGQDAYGIFLPPTNPEVQAPVGTKPPLMVTVHGGPTAVSSPTFNLSDLYWTSRGFAILKLNYRGSTGFGRRYRQALAGKWGDADVEDAVFGARWAAKAGLADPDRLIIRGGSAGGLTTLAAHALYDTFAVGASYFGISDLEALAQETHKFESRYMDTLIGPYPEQQAKYRELSPINHLDGFSKPLLLLQGLKDPVVPPSQSEMIFEALKSRGIPTAYITFPGESHGFRKAENRIHALQSELAFYARVLELNPEEPLVEVEIIGLNDQITSR